MVVKKEETLMDNNQTNVIVFMYLFHILTLPRFCLRVLYAAAVHLCSISIDHGLEQLRMTALSKYFFSVFIHS